MLPVSASSSLRVNAGLRVAAEIAGGSPQSFGFKKRSPFNASQAEVVSLCFRQVAPSSHLFRAYSSNAIYGAKTAGISVTCRFISILSILGELTDIQ